jgi:hypothetical protein
MDKTRARDARPWAGQQLVGKDIELLRTMRSMRAWMNLRIAQGMVATMQRWPSRLCLGTVRLRLTTCDQDTGYSHATRGGSRM